MIVGLVAAALSAAVALWWYRAARPSSPVPPPRSAESPPPAPAEARPSDTGPPAEPAPGPPPPEVDDAVTLVAIQVEALAGLGSRFGEGLGLQARAEVTDALRGALRAGDTCTPWGADRFVALLPGIDRQRAGGVLLRVQRALSSLTVLTRTGEEIRLQVQVASVCAPDDGASVGELLEAAGRHLEASRTASIDGDDPRGDPAARLRQAIPLVLN